MQLKRYHFSGFTAKNAGGPVVFNEQKQKQKQKEPQRLQRPQYRTRMAM